MKLSAVQCSCSGSGFGPVQNPFNITPGPTNREPDYRSGSEQILNLNPKIGPVRSKSGPNHGSEPDRGIASHRRRCLQPVIHKSPSPNQQPAKPCSTPPTGTKVLLPTLEAAHLAHPSSRVLTRLFSLHARTSPIINTVGSPVSPVAKTPFQISTHSNF
jgi:hypothetical protein